MPRAEREKGRRRENQIVAALGERGIDALRISRPYISSDDLEIVHPLRGGLTGEVKARKDASGWKTIKTWKRNADVLFLVEDRTSPLVVVDFDLFCDIFIDGIIR